jgi:hypothetical protein
MDGRQRSSPPQPLARRNSHPGENIMNVQKIIAAAAVLVVAGSAFAADAPAAGVAAAPAAAAASSVVIASNLNLPSVSIRKSAAQTRADVQAGAVEFVKNYKTALTVQLDQYKN